MKKNNSFIAALMMILLVCPSCSSISAAAYKEQLELAERDCSKILPKNKLGDPVYNKCVDAKTSSRSIPSDNGKTASIANPLHDQTEEFLGKPLAEFMDAIGMGPTQEVKTKIGKNFFFTKSGQIYVPPTSVPSTPYCNNPALCAPVDKLMSSIYSKPGYYRNISCNAIVKTKQVGKTDTIDDYMIKEIVLSGNC